MAQYDLGDLIVVDHKSKTLTGAFNLPEKRFKEIVKVSQVAWDHGETISESVEYLAQNLKDSELVLGLLILGRIWEENSTSPK